MRFLAAIGLVLVTACANVDEKEAAATAEDVAAYCDDLDLLATRDRIPIRFFADVSSGARPGPSDWREFATGEDLAGQDTGDNLDTSARVHSLDGRPVHASFMYQSPSRDWAHYAFYCFRADGSLARMSSELRTFYGDVRVVRSVSYGPSREILSSSEQILDLESGDPVETDRSFMDREAPIFWTPDEFPFHELMSAEGSD